MDDARRPGGVGTAAAPGVAAWTRLSMAMLAVSSLAPACLAASSIGNLPDSAHDTGVARVLGLTAEPWRALDVVFASLLAGLPLGTRAARAGLGEALVVAAVGAALYAVTRQIASECADAPRVGPIAAAVATLTALCSPAWQWEGGAVAGSVTGALLVLLPVAVLARSDDAAAKPRWRPAVFVLGLALGYEPLVGVCAVGGCAAMIGVGPNARRAFVRACRTDGSAMALFCAAGLSTFLTAFVRARAEAVSLLGTLSDGWSGERGVSLSGSPVAFLRTEVGPVLGALAAGGAILAMLVPRARALAAGLLVVVIIGFASGWAGAPLGPTRFAATVLAAVGAVCAFAGIAMQAVVRKIAEAKLPMARASAAMILVLELALPVEFADEAMLRTSPRTSPSADVWEDLAWGELPARAVVLVTDARLGRRAARAQALGTMRGDVLVVPAMTRGALGGRRVLSKDAALVPLWRDLELSGSPSEASLSSLALVRPIAMAYEPRWGHELGKHLVPIALLDRFEAEPRGASDRKRLLDAFAPKRARLARSVAKDRELADAAAYLMRARAIDLAASGDRELIGRALDDLRAFAPDDPVAAAIAARAIVPHGAAKVDDLRP